MRLLRQLTVLVLLTVLLLQTGCSNNHEKGVAKSEQQPVETYRIEGFIPEPTYTPIDEYIDLSGSFSASDDDPFVDGEIKSSLTCSKQSGETYVQSDDCVVVQAGSQSMMVFCAWGPQDRIVYIGLKHAETGNCYMLPSTGGSAIGTIDLTDVPAGEYYVILCSNDNPSIVAVLHYQIV